MNKKLLYALLLLGVVVITLLFNSGKVEVSLIFTEFHALKSLVFLGFTACGVVIGVLLH